MALMERYHWPGNVRELRHVVERAVLLARGERIILEHLPLERMRATFAARRIVPATPTTPEPAAQLERPTPAIAQPERRGPDAVIAPAVQEPSRDDGADRNLKGELARVEREQILEALKSAAGNQKEAALLLGISRRKLINRLETYGISGPRKRRGSESGA